MPIEPAPLTRNSAYPAQPLTSTAHALEEGDVATVTPTGDRISTPATTATRRSQLPSLRTIAKEAGKVVLTAGATAGAYAGIQHGVRPRPFVDKTHFVSRGNILINSTIAKDFDAAVATMQQFPGPRALVQRLRNAPESPLGGQLDVQPGVDSYSFEENRIRWNTTQKIEVPSSNSTEAIGTLSPVGLLVHEMHHADNAREFTPAFVVRLGLPHPEFDNLEEKKACDQTNADLANFSGESERSDHHNGALGLAQNVTDHANTSFPIDALTQINASRDQYANTSIPFSETLGRIHQQALALFSTAIGSARLYYPNSFNDTNMAKAADLIDEGRKLTTRYASTRYNPFGYSTVSLKEIEAELDSYVQRGEDFAASLKKDSGDDGTFNQTRYLDSLGLSPASKTKQKSRAKGGAPAPAPAAIAINHEPPLAPISAPAGAGAPEPKRN